MPPSTRNVDAVMNDASSLGEERDRGRELLGLGEAAHRDVHEAALRALGVLREQLLQQRRVDRAGAQRVDADALARELHAEFARHREHAALGGGVRDLDVALPITATNDAVLMIEPDCCGTMWRSAAREHRYTLLRLTSCTRSHAGSSVVSIESSSGGEMPALLKAMSSEP